MAINLLPQRIVESRRVKSTAPPDEEVGERLRGLVAALSEAGVEFRIFETKSNGILTYSFKGR